MWRLVAPVTNFLTSKYSDFWTKSILFLPLPLERVFFCFWLPFSISDLNLRLLCCTSAHQKVNCNSDLARSPWRQRNHKWPHSPDRDRPHLFTHYMMQSQFHLTEEDKQARQTRPCCVPGHHSSVSQCPLLCLGHRVRSSGHFCSTKTHRKRLALIKTEACLSARPFLF